MAETWYFRSAAGAACGPGTRRALNQVAGAAAATQDVTTEHTWNRTESARTIQAGNWSVFADITTGAGGGAPNRVTVVVERRNSSCVVQQTIGSVEVAMSAGTTQEYTFDFGAQAAVVFSAGDILTVRIVRSNGARSQVLRFDDVDPSDADTRLVTPDASGTTFTQSVGGALSFGGAITKKTAKPLAGALTSTGQLTRKTSKPLLAGTLTSTGAITRKTSKPLLAGTLTSSGALQTRLVFTQAVAGVLTFAGTLSRTVRKSVSGVLTSAGALSRKVAKQLAGGLSFSGGLRRTTKTAKAGTLAPTGSLATSFRGFVSVSGVLAFLGTLASVFIPASLGGAAKRMRTWFGRFFR